MIGAIFPLAVEIDPVDSTGSVHRVVVVYLYPYTSIISIVASYIFQRFI